VKLVELYRRERWVAYAVAAAVTIGAGLIVRHPIATIVLSITILAGLEER